MKNHWTATYIMKNEMGTVVGYIDLRQDSNNLNDVNISFDYREGINYEKLFKDQCNGKEQYSFVEAITVIEEFVNRIEKLKVFK